jgi:copper chaperone CopZ
LIWRKLGSRVAAVYLAAIAAGSLAFGGLLDVAYKALALDATAALGTHAMLPLWLKTSGAVAFGLLIGTSLVRKASALVGHGAACCKHEETSSTEGALVLSIDGMTCAHCVESVEAALSALPGAEKVTISLTTHRATVTGAVDPDQAVAAVGKAGYSAVIASQPGRAR